jgi:hypothetical protein
MGHLIRQRSDRATSQDGKHTLQGDQILLRDPDNRPIDQRQLDPRRRTSTENWQLHELRVPVSR